MLTRRSLFARLSAVALAPLVKLVPKEEPHVWLFLKQPGRWTPKGWKPYHVLEFYPSDWQQPHSPPESLESLDQMMNRIIAKQVSSVPQEEA